MHLRQTPYRLNLLVSVPHALRLSFLSSLKAVEPSLAQIFYKSLASAPKFQYTVRIYFNLPSVRIFVSGIESPFTRTVKTYLSEYLRPFADFWNLIKYFCSGSLRPSYRPCGQSVFKPDFRKPIQIPAKLKPCFQNKVSRVKLFIGLPSLVT